MILLYRGLLEKSGISLKKVPSVLTLIFENVGLKIIQNSENSYVTGYKGSWSRIKHRL